MISRSILLLFIFSLIACGGSSGDGNTKPPTSTAGSSSTLSASSQTSSAESSIVNESSSSEFSSDTHQSSSSSNTTSSNSSSSNSSSVENMTSLYGTVYHHNAATTIDLRAVCSDGHNASKSVTVHDFGNYSINVKESAFPCFLQAKYNNSPVTLHSYAFEGGRVNITALTDLTVAFHLNDLPEVAFSAEIENVCGAVCMPNREQIIQSENLIKQTLSKKLYKYESSFFTSEIIDGDNQVKTLSALLQSIQLSTYLSDYLSLLVLIKDGNLSSVPENIHAQSNSSSSQSYSSSSSNSSSTAPAPSYEAGKHYTVLDQAVSTSDPSKIEVVEVFSYHCGSCFQFESVLQAWKKQLAHDVVVVQIPAIWNAPMEIMAQAFYAAKALKIDDKSHMAIFNAIHLERETLSSAEQWVDFLSNFGVESETLSKTFDSLDVKNQVSQASARARSYGITSAPELVVNGKYRINSREASSHIEMLKVVDFLIALERDSGSPSDASLTEGQEFLAANKEKEGVVTTESGLQYRILTKGAGIKPTVRDSVTVHYRGKLLDGTEFDSSYARQQPVTFPVNGVIAGWKEALQLMPQGSKWELYIPADLAYGPSGNGQIPPNSTLIFEVELLEVSKW